jgi:hypothetical protein
VVDFHIVGNVALGQLGGFEQYGELLGALTHFNLVADLDLVGWDVDALAIDQDVAMVDELAGSKRSCHELGAVDDRVEARFKQADQVLAGVAFDASGFAVELLEALFGDRGVVALELLLGAQLQTVVRKLALTALAVLFSPRRRSILCFAEMRFDIAYPFLSRKTDRALLCHPRRDDRQTPIV